MDADPSVRLMTVVPSTPVSHDEFSLLRSTVPSIRVVDVVPSGKTSVFEPSRLATTSAPLGSSRRIVPSGSVSVLTGSSAADPSLRTV